jgi:hypothetical protein
LKSDPKLAGKGLVTVKLAKDGKVTDATYTRDGLSESVMQCIAGHVKAARFPPPKTGKELKVPVRFASGEGAK